MLAYIIEKSYTTENIYIIDQGYLGKSDDIKRYILLSLHDLQIPISKAQIDFAFIGKKSEAHKIVYTAYKYRIASRELSPRDILKLFHP